MELIFTSTFELDNKISTISPLLYEVFIVKQRMVS